MPFIFVSGTLGEEVAIEALKIGATDYVLKTRLSRLVPSVHRALREARERAERRQRRRSAAAERSLPGGSADAEPDRQFRLGCLELERSTGPRKRFEYLKCDPATKPTLELVI